MATAAALSRQAGAGPRYNNGWRTMLLLLLLLALSLSLLDVVGRAAFLGMTLCV